MLNEGGVLVIGLDGATWDLLAPLMDAGWMPTLRRLVDAGTSGPLVSEIPPVTGPAWASFQTGANPGKHGVVDFLCYRPGSYDPTLLDARAIEVKTVWELLSDYGKRVCALNVPVTYPPRAVNGALVSGLLTPGADAAFTYPPELRARLLAQVPGYEPAPQVKLQTVGPERFVQAMVETVRRRCQAALWLLEQDAWDLFMVHLQAVDLIQHALWDRLEGQAPDAATLGRDFYGEVDRCLAALLAAAPDASVIVMSDHGFGRARRRVYLNRWLVERGYLALTASDLWLRGHALLEDVVRRVDVLHLRHRLLPKDFKRERGRLIRRLTQDPWIDWARTRAYVFSGTTYAGVYLNLRGREPQGCVAPSEYEALREAVAACFAELRDPETGEPVVTRVYRREEVYAGPAAERLPDLIVRPLGGYMLETRLKGTRLFGPAPAWITGMHRRDGIYALSGRPFVASPQRRAAHITDVVPTVLTLLGVPVPPWMDGAPLTWAVNPDVAPPPMASPAAASGEAAPMSGPPPTTAEEAPSEVVDRLRDLGYL